MSKPILTKQVTSVFLAALMVLFLIPALGVAADAIHFAYQFKPGYSQDFKGEFSQEQDFFGTSYVVLVEMEITEKCVEAVGDTLFKMEIFFNEVSSSTRMNDNLMPNRMGEALKGQTITYQVNRVGDVTDVKAKSYITGWGEISQVANSILSGWYPSLPDSSIEVGGTWDEKSVEHPDASPGLEVKNDITFDFKELKKEKGKNCAKVEGEGDSILKGEVLSGYGQFNMDGTAKSKFEFYFNPDGIGIVKFKSSMQMDAKMIEITDSPSKKPEENETHMSYEIKKELK